MNPKLFEFHQSAELQEEKSLLKGEYKNKGGVR
jgi:hypothetical protein